MKIWSTKICQMQNWTILYIKKKTMNIALNGSSIYIKPDNCEYAIRVFSSDTDNPKGSITYKGQELVKEQCHKMTGIWENLKKTGYLL